MPAEVVQCEIRLVYRGKLLRRAHVAIVAQWAQPYQAQGPARVVRHDAVAADVIGRVVARPEEIEVGIITAFIGAPVFIWIVRRQKVREL